MIISKSDQKIKIMTPHFGIDGYIQGFVTSSQAPLFLTPNSIKNAEQKKFDSASLVKFDEMVFILDAMTFKSHGFLGFLRIKISPLDAMKANGWTEKEDK